MDDLIERAKNLHYEILKRQEKIDNPALVQSVLSELDFFIENVNEEDSE